MEKILFMSLFILLLTACATEDKYNHELQQIIGKPLQDVEAKFGRPSAKKIISPDYEIITYTKADKVYVPSEYYLYNQGFEPDAAVIYGPFNQDYDWSPAFENGYELKYICQTSFIIKNGIVSGYSWQGNDCLSY